jgi:hypothetical protein
MKGQIPLRTDLYQPLQFGTEGFLQTLRLKNCVPILWRNMVSIVMNIFCLYGPLQNEEKEMTFLQIREYERQTS